VRRTAPPTRLAAMPTRLAAAPVLLFAAFVLTAVITPSPDAVSMLALVVPLWALLYAAFEVALFVHRRRTGRGGRDRGGEP
jgi:Sec-independent protein secretion pathway component TatC